MTDSDGFASTVSVDFEMLKQEFGANLKALRRQAALTGEQLAERAGMSQPKISKIETGKVMPSITDVERIADALELESEETSRLREQLEVLLTQFSSWRQLHGSGLKQAQREARDTETASRLIRYFQPYLIPGLLQTPEYARHILERSNPTNRADVAEAVAARLERQTILYEEGRSFEFLLCEAALRARYGPIAVMLHQIEWLRSMLSIPNVEIGILPFDTEMPRVALNGFGLFDERLVQIETFGGEFSIEGPQSVAGYVEVFASLRGAATTGEAAGRVLEAVAAEYRGCSRPSRLDG